jgi:hypothetical protein
MLLVTVCTKHRRKILANPKAHALLREAWETCNDFSVGRYVILPNHIHLFLGDSDVAPCGLDRGLARGRPTSQGAGQTKRISHFGNEAIGIVKCGAIKPAK